MGRRPFEDRVNYQIVEYPETFLAITPSEYSPNAKAIGRTPLVPPQYRVVLR
jgi:hypothetical protein